MQEVTDVRRASQRTARSSRHVSVAGSARGSVHSLAADATAAQSRHRDPDDAEGEASAQNSASENSEGDHEDGSDADVGVAIDGDHWSDHQADRGSAGPEENRVRTQHTKVVYVGSVETVFKQPMSTALSSEPEYECHHVQLLCIIQNSRKA